ncbi:hypothetical protein F5J12DRAFT_785783 [Pisolithus orientalis]|uniref:uncharacterized protein n=1 Tax=Pisolithus orientalis TaxID=936130 RepID=UPI00222401A3|nr:uncharacterized protein F5J12DRAFT_785783 [Pisolithus orientalis]KAI5994601.1 hypothetical protein F5J12DRAFT_785783 [Pisolithus orientalis]
MSQALSSRVILSCILVSSLTNSYIRHKVSREWDSFLQSDCQIAGEEVSGTHEEADTAQGAEEDNKMSGEEEDDDTDLDEDEGSSSKPDDDKLDDNDGELVAGLDDNKNLCNYKFANLLLSGSGPFASNMGPYYNRVIMAGKIRAMTVNMLQDVMYLEINGALSSWNMHYFDVNITTPGRK